MTTAKLPPAPDRQRLQNFATTALPIDTGVLFSNCMGNVSFALTLLDELEARGKQQVDAIVLYATRNEGHAAAEAAHSLRGAAAIIGAESLRGIAVGIEAAGDAGETSLLLDLIHDLRSEMDRCLDYIPTIRAETQRR